jgi:hypothetical protein
LLICRDLVPETDTNRVVCEIEPHGKVHRAGFVIAGADEILAAGIGREALERALDQSVGEVLRVLAVPLEPVRAAIDISVEPSALDRRSSIVYF